MIGSCLDMKINSGLFGTQYDMADVVSVVTVMMLLKWWCRIVGAVMMLLQWWCCCSDDVVAVMMLLQWWCCCTVAVMMLLQWVMMILLCCLVERIPTTPLSFARWGGTLRTWWVRRKDSSELPATTSASRPEGGQLILEHTSMPVHATTNIDVRSYHNKRGCPFMKDNWIQSCASHTFNVYLWLLLEFVSKLMNQFIIINLSIVNIPANNYLLIKAVFYIIMDIFRM